MDKTTDLNKLFSNWKQKYPPGKFAEDGIIDEPSWIDAPNKILFIMKETNDYPGDVRAFVDEKP